MRFAEAFEKLIAGQAICSAGFYDKDARWLIENGKLIERKNKGPDIILRWISIKNSETLFSENSWQIYVAPLRFSNLRAGQKFNFKNGTYKCMRVNGTNHDKSYVILNSGRVQEHYSDEEVVLCD